MKRNLLVGLFTLIICFTLTGCDKSELTNSKEMEISTTTIKEKAELNEIENVSMTIKKGTLTRNSATIIITDSNEITNTYGSEYRIDKKENGIWKEAEIIFDGNYGWNSIGYQVDKNKQLEMDINWKSLYGYLENGEYRIVKYVTSNKIDETNNKKYFSTEFIISK